MSSSRSCPLTTRQIADEYFIENRTRILELAAFLDRLDRSCDGAPAANDFRIRALKRALELLASEESDRIGQVQLLFSDPTTEPKPKLDTKSACGAWDPATAASETN